VIFSVSSSSKAVVVEDWFLCNHAAFDGIGSCVLGVSNNTNIHALVWQQMTWL